MLRFTVKDLRPHFYKLRKKYERKFKRFVHNKKKSMCIKKNIEGVGFEIGNHSHNSLVQSYLLQGPPRQSGIK